MFGDVEIEQKMKFRTAVNAIALAPDYKDSGKIVIGSDKITLCEKGLLGSKKSSTLAVGIVRVSTIQIFHKKISKISNKISIFLLVQTLLIVGKVANVVWADDKDVKIFDLNKREVISIIPRSGSICTL